VPGVPLVAFADVEQARPAGEELADLRDAYLR
jgi:hypothetical protein